MEDAATKGKEAFAESVESLGRTFPRLPSLLRRDVTIGNLTFDELEKRLNKKVVSKLREGMVSGKSALEMLNTLPAVERGAVLRMLNNPATWGKTGAAAARAAAVPAAPTNNLAPESRKENALAP